MLPYTAFKPARFLFKPFKPLVVSFNSTSYIVLRAASLEETSKIWSLYCLNDAVESPNDLIELVALEYAFFISVKAPIASLVFAAYSLVAIEASPISDILATLSPNLPRFLNRPVETRSPSRIEPTRTPTAQRRTTKKGSTSRRSTAPISPYSKKEITPKPIIIEGSPISPADSSIKPSRALTAPLERIRNTQKPTATGDSPTVPKEISIK